MDTPHAPATPSRPHQRQAELIARALAHIDARLGQPLTVDTLADKAAMSRFHFHRVFFAHLGCSVGTYVAWRRLQRACALLASGRESVLEIALEVGFESAQALAKAMRRTLDTTPTAVRQRLPGAWQAAATPWRVSEPFTPRPPPPEGADMPQPIQPTRHATLPPGLVALTATARGMVNRTMERAARQAFGELVPALQRSGLYGQAWSWLSICPDDPQGPDDPHCRYVAGVVFGYAMANGEGHAAPPPAEALPLSGSLAWQPLSAGRHAVFTHVGPYAELHRIWAAIYRDWLPASGETLRDAPPMELMLNSPQDTLPEALRTEIWVPVAG
jgi:AraC family transcriptional regulator